MKMESVIFNFCSWIWKFAVLNLFWSVGTLLGGVVLGIMPSTVATFYVLRKWVQGDLEINIFESFKGAYKKEFLKSNKCGAVFLGIFLFLAFDLWILYQIDAIYATIIYILVNATLFFSVIAFIYFFPTYVHFELSTKDYIKNSFMLSMGSPKETILILIGIALLAYFVKSSPGLLIYFAVVVPGYWVMNILYKKFLKLQRA